MIRKTPKNTETFCFYNANPKGKRTSDCVIRAISKATGKEWDTVLDELTAFSHKYKVMPNDTACYGKYLESLGFTKEKQPRQWDNTKYTGKDFCKLQSTKFNNAITGVSYAYDIVAHIGGHHIVAIQIDTDKKYKVFDIWDCTDKTIGNYWIRRRKEK